MASERPRVEPADDWPDTLRENPGTEAVRRLGVKEFLVVIVVVNDLDSETYT